MSGGQWAGLNQHLLATFWEVDRKGARLGAANVVAPLTESTLEMSLQWQSPFENAGAESKAPALMAMLQSGALQPVMAALGLDGGDGKAKAGTSNALAAAGGVNGTLAQFEGRTGITKVNSTQVFTGMAPVKFSVTVLLRAWLNPVTEVEAAYDQFMQWALPKALSPDGMVVNTIQAVKGEGGWIDMLMPSEAPTMIALHYKNRTYKPLVIESISQPLDASIDQYGRYTQLLVPLTLASLTAWDRADWRQTRG